MSTFMNGRARLYQPRMTMQALAARLSAQLRAPVADATGLTGQYEISLYWVTDAGLRAAAPPHLVSIVPLHSPCVRGLLEIQLTGARLSPCSWRR
jgi:uncharacterized protein (TIGR03435 family)